MTPATLARQNIAMCYLATREHPTLGVLMKVGSSIHPNKRINDLGADPFIDRLAQAEADRDEARRIAGHWSNKRDDARLAVDILRHVDEILDRAAPLYPDTRTHVAIKDALDVWDRE